MAKRIKEVQLQQNSVGINGDALNNQELRETALNLLTVSGGYISTERDEMGNILLYEDPNNIGSNKQLVTQWISVDLARRDYDDDELQKVFDTNINELFKVPKTKTAAELRAEIERMRRLLADAESDINITIQEIIVSESIGTTPTGPLPGESGFRTVNSAQIAIPAQIDIGIKLNSLDESNAVLNVDTAIWSDDNHQLEEYERPIGEIRYEILQDIATNDYFVKLTSNISSPQQFQGWYFDKENQLDTSTYELLQGRSSVVTIPIVKRELIENNSTWNLRRNIFTVAAAYIGDSPSGAPPGGPTITTTDVANILIQEQDFIDGRFANVRDDTIIKFNYNISDPEGNIIAGAGKDDVNNPYNVSVKVENTIRFWIETEPDTNIEMIQGWWIIAQNDDREQISTGPGQHSVEFVATADIKGLLIVITPKIIV